jgi:hypothetical protein
MREGCHRGEVAVGEIRTRGTACGSRRGKARRTGGGLPGNTVLLLADNARVLTATERLLQKS